MSVHPRLVYILVGLRPSDLRSRTDPTLRYSWVFLADDDSRGVLHDTVICRCYPVRAGSTSLLRQRGH